MPSIYDEAITTVYTDMLELYEVDDNGNIKYKLSEDTVVNPHKAYYLLSSGVYTRIPSPAGSPVDNGFYEQICVRMNGSGEWITFNDFDYMPCAFSLSLPDTTAVSEESGSLNIAGVTGDYVEMIQTATGTLMLKDGVIKVSEAYIGEYLIAPVELEISSISINSAAASLDVSLKSGGILSYYASRYEYNISKFPGISG